MSKHLQFIFGTFAAFSILALVLLPIDLIERHLWLGLLLLGVIALSVVGIILSAKYIL